MKKRPKLKLELTQVDKTIEIIGWLLFFTDWAMTVINYQRLPDIIPIHFNGAVVADRFGDKWMILTLPSVATVLFVGLTILNKFPHIFNYPTEITADNALRQYTNATRLIRYLKVSIIVIFGLITFQTIGHTNEQTEGLGFWFLPLIMGLIFIPLIYFLINSTDKNK
jgi:hypothetical protein